MERYCDFDRKDERCIHRPVKKVLFLECGNRPQEATFQIDGGAVLPEQFVLDRIFIDTKKLCKPLIKFEFSSLVSFVATDTDGEDPLTVSVNLLFTLVRVCGPGPNNAEVIQSWEYINSTTVTDTALTLESSEPFTVTFCDTPNPCERGAGCCEYRIVVEGVAFAGTFTSLRVTRPDLSAIVQGVIEE